MQTGIYYRPLLLPSKLRSGRAPWNIMHGTIVSLLENHFYPSLWFSIIHVPSSWKEERIRIQSARFTQWCMGNNLLFSEYRLIFLSGSICCFFFLLFLFFLFCTAAVFTSDLQQLSPLGKRSEKIYASLWRSFWINCELYIFSEVSYPFMVIKSIRLNNCKRVWK